MEKPEKSKKAAEEASHTEEPKQETCGIIMPISDIDGYPRGHWSDVLKLIQAAITDAGFIPNMVSNGDEVGVIQKRIVQNIYDNPIIICDVSGKNPNVMFELGMRLAFDKPVIIVKDELTPYSFDTGIIDHIPYQSDLNWFQIEDFKRELSSKIKSTVKASKDDLGYTTFLKHFQEVRLVPGTIDKQEVAGQEFIVAELQSIKEAVSALASKQPNRENSGRYKLLLPQKIYVDFDSKDRFKVEEIINAMFNVLSVSISANGPKDFMEMKATVEVAAESEDLAIGQVANRLASAGVAAITSPLPF